MKTLRSIAIHASALMVGLGLTAASSCSGGGADPPPPPEPLAVTVRVVGISASDQAQSEPVAGALVTLTHPAGLETGTTGPDGRAVFFDIPGPYTATAQLDHLVIGADGQDEVVRLASSVISTRAVDIGVPIFLSEVRSGVGASDSLLRVLVDDRPETGTLWTRVEESDGARPDFDSGWIPLAATTSTQAAVEVEVPSGVRFGLVVAHFPTGFPPEFGGDSASSIMVDAAVPPTAAGATAERALSWSGPDRIDIDQPITLDVDGGAELAHLHEITLELRSRHTSYTARVAVHHQEFVFDGFPDDLPLLVADPAHPVLADFVYAIRPREEVNFFDVEAHHDVEWFPPCVLPNYHAVQLPLRPALQEPMPNAFIPFEEVDQLVVRAAGLAEWQAPGYTITRLGSADPGHGVDGFHWWIFTGPSTDSFRLPRATLPMFTGDSAWFLEVGKARLEGGTPIDFKTFFGSDVGANMLAVDVPQEPCGSFEWLRASARASFFLIGGGDEEEL